jgi:hypothetical protein
MAHRGGSAFGPSCQILTLLTLSMLLTANIGNKLTTGYNCYADMAGVEEAAGKQDDLQELELMYTPVRWKPSKEDVEDECWRQYLEKHAGAKRKGPALKEATQELNSKAIQARTGLVQNLAFSFSRRVFRSMGCMFLVQGCLLASLGP